MVSDTLDKPQCQSSSGWHRRISESHSEAAQTAAWDANSCPTGKKPEGISKLHSFVA